MKPLNLLLCCLVFISCVSACKKESDNTLEEEPVNNIEVGDFGLKPGECIAIKEFVDEELKIERNFNSENNIIVVKTFADSEVSKIENLELNTNGDIVKITEFRDGQEKSTAEYFYNNEDLIEQITFRTTGGFVPQNKVYTYSEDACKLQQVCLDFIGCTSYTYTDENCSHNMVVPDVDQQYFYENTLDDKQQPTSKLAPKTGTKNGNLIHRRVTISGFSGDSTYEEKREDFNYNEQGYPLSFNLLGTEYNETEFLFQGNYTYQYFCFE